MTKPPRVRVRVASSPESRARDRERKAADWKAGRIRPRLRSPEARARDKAHRAERRKTNYAEVIAVERANHQRNIASRMEQNRVYRAANRDRLLIYQRERGALLRDDSREKKLIKIYGMTADDYALRLAAQNGVCAICRGAERLRDKRTGELRRMAVDHDHVSGSVRGLLCATCNTLLGRARDGVAILQAAIAYLEAAAAAPVAA
jgi:hypothetical protein